MAHCIHIMRTRENKDIAPGHSGPHCAVLACVSTSWTSPAAKNKSLSLSQLDAPQPCLWLLRPTQQTEVDIRDLPAGYLVIPPHITRVTSKALFHWPGFLQVRVEQSHPLCHVMFCPPITLCNAQPCPTEAVTVQNYLSQQPGLTHSHSTSIS